MTRKELRDLIKGMPIEYRDENGCRVGFIETGLTDDQIREKALKSLLNEEVDDHAE